MKDGGGAYRMSRIVGPTRIVKLGPVKVNRWEVPKMKIRAPAAHNENRCGVGLHGGPLLEIKNGNPGFPGFPPLSIGERFMSRCR
jgi:hypothetical protein